MTAVDAGDWKQIWQAGHPIQFDMNKAASGMVLDPSPHRSSPRELFSIGMTGIVTAFDASTGQQLWQHRLDLVPDGTTHRLPCRRRRTRGTSISAATIRDR